MSMWCLPHRNDASERLEIIANGASDDVVWLLLEFEWTARYPETLNRHLKGSRRRVSHIEWSIRAGCRWAASNRCIRETLFLRSRTSSALRNIGTIRLIRGNGLPSASWRVGRWWDAVGEDASGELIALAKKRAPNQRLDKHHTFGIHLCEKAIEKGNKILVIEN